MVRVGEIGFESSEYLIARKTSGSGYKPNQRTNLVGCSTLSINNRVRQIGDIADNTDTHLHANDTFLDECRTQAVKYLLPCIEPREQANNQDTAAHEDTNQSDDRPAEPVHPLAVCIGSRKPHHYEPENHDDNANGRQDRCYEPNLWPRLVQITEIRRDRFNGCHHIGSEKVTDLGNGVNRCNTIEPRDPRSSVDVSPVVCNYNEIGDGLGKARGGRGDSGKHLTTISKARIVGHKVQQSRNFGADLIKRQSQK